VEREFQDSLLPNGIHLHTYVTDRFKTVLCKLYIHQPLGPKASATALLPFVLGRGCRTYPTLRDIARRLEELYGAIFSADVVKIGERQLIELGLSVPEEKVLGVSGLLGEAVQTLAEVVCHPLLEGEGFNQEYFRQERELLLRKIDGLINDKPRYAMLRLFQEMCPKEPFGIHKYGSREEIEGLTAASLFAHYQEIRQGQCDLFVVGNVSPSQVEEAVQGAFADGWRSREFPPVSEGTPQGGVEIREEQDVNQGILAMGMRTGVTYRDEDYPALLFYNGILGGFPHSKLFINVRERASLAYFAFSRLEPTKGVLAASAGIDVNEYERARDIIKEQIDALAAGDISDEELEATRRGLIHRQLTISDDPAGLVDSHLLGLINNRIRPQRELIDQLGQVAREDVVRVAQGVQPDVTFFLCGPREREGN
jgi:predicted Zn-dependent peptidase